jgi:small-conductance mechanosensitive channel
MDVYRLRMLFFTLAATVAMAAAPTAQETGVAGVETEIATAPVEFDGVVLFRVRGVSSLPATARARLIQERLATVAADRGIPVETMHVIDGPATSQIVAGGRPVMTIVDADAALEQVQRPQLAAAHRARLQQAVADYREARSIDALRRGAVNSLTATLILAVAIVAIARLWRAVDRLFTRHLEKRIHAVEIQSFEVMRAEQIVTALRRAAMTIRMVAFLSVALPYLAFMLAQWPWTRGASRAVIGFALAPLQIIGTGIVANVPSLVFLTVLCVVVREALRLIRLFFAAVERGTVTLAGFDADWAQPTYKIVRLAIVAFGLIVAYPYIPGSDTAAFSGITVFIGIVFSLGSSSAISNIIAGYMMTYRRAFRVGDRVRIGDAVGDVVEMRLQVTHLRSVKNEELVIPNSQILTSQVLNYSSLARTCGLILHTEVGIGYDTPWRQVEAMLLAAAERTAGLSREPRPFVLEKRLGDFAVTYELNAYSSNVPAMAHLYAELHRNILDVFNEHDVQIMTPAYEGDPVERKVVARKDWYTVPARSPENKRAAVSSTPAPGESSRASSG